MPARPPLVAIVGRPNVGKSSLMNALAGERIAIVSPTPGVTRDRVSRRIDAEGRSFELMDTGGIGLLDSEPLRAAIEAQIEFAIEGADLVLFVADAAAGRLPSDAEIGRRLREAGRAVLLVVNKADRLQHEARGADFVDLGFGEPICVSATHRRNLDLLLERIVAALAGFPAADESEIALRFAVVGRPNVGKSTFVNALAREERVIVSEVPGTTRDAVDVRFERAGRAYLAIDTAGLRNKMDAPLDRFSRDRALTAIRRADAVMWMLDATEPTARTDKVLGALLDKAGKPTLIGVNKWDLAKGVTPEDYARYFAKTLPVLAFAPVVFLSAKTGARLWDTIRILEELHLQAGRKVPTPLFNRLVEALQRGRTPIRAGRAGRIYYGTQTGVNPPSFVFFVNDLDAFGSDYRRYAENRLREALPFPEVPVRIQYRARRRKEWDRPRRRHHGGARR